MLSSRVRGKREKEGKRAKKRDQKRKSERARPRATAGDLESAVVSLASNPYRVVQRVVASALLGEKVGEIT